MIKLKKVRNIVDCFIIILYNN